MEAFVDAESIGLRFFEKPYILVPGKKAEKGYVLLRETLKETGKVGIARVVIRTREYICAVMPEGDALIMILLRYPQELVAPDEYKLPQGASDYRVAPKELEMAKQLIESMTSEWEPDSYQDEFRERLSDIIKKRVKQAGATTTFEEPEHREDSATNVVDFMALLQKSLETNKRTPASNAGEDRLKSSTKDSKPAKKAAIRRPQQRKPQRKPRQEGSKERLITKENPMSDDKKNTGSPDRDRINVNEDYELQYWTKALGVSADELQPPSKPWAPPLRPFASTWATRSRHVLVEYRRKRRFDQTKEPEPGKALPQGQRAIFVVQLHHASRRHYDFRLQIGDALKSWAVPKALATTPRSNGWRSKWKTIRRLR